MATCVITGAGTGIGKATALAFGALGYDVALVGRTATTLAAVAEAIVLGGGRAMLYCCDVANASEVEAMSREVQSRLGTPDAVINNAGVVRRAPVHEMTEAAWDTVIGTNLKGTFLVTRAFLPAMRQERRGRVVCVGSISSTLGTANQAAYAAAKWGVLGFVKSLAEELRETGVQTLAVLPGSVDTAMLDGSGFSPDMTPDDVAKVIVYAAVQAPSAMNGSAIEVFGP